MLRFLALTIIALTLIMASPAHSQETQEPPEPGSKFLVDAFCITGEATENLAAAAIQRADDGYWSAIGNPDIKCFDRRTHPTPKLPVVVTKKAFRIVRIDGLVFDFWLATVGTSERTVYFWTLVTDVTDEPTSTPEDAGSPT